MATKRQSATDRPAEVFRQFAWHLAGTLAIGAAAGAKAGDGATRPPAKGRGGR